MEAFVVDEDGVAEEAAAVAVEEGIAVDSVAVAAAIIRTIRLRLVLLYISDKRKKVRRAACCTLGCKHVNGLASKRRICTVLKSCKKRASCPNRCWQNMKKKMELKQEKSANNSNHNKTLGIKMTKLGLSIEVVHDFVAQLLKNHEISCQLSVAKLRE